MWLTDVVEDESQLDLKYLMEFFSVIQTGRIWESQKYEKEDAIFSCLMSSMRKRVFELARSSQFTYKNPRSRGSVGTASPEVNMRSSFQTQDSITFPTF